jgi:hypothetical protein
MPCGKGIEEQVLVGSSAVEKNLHVTKTVSPDFTRLQGLIPNCCYLVTRI